MAYLLKIFSGPHLGAEVLLDEGEFVLGSGEESDLVLSDLYLAPRHIKLKVSEGRVYLSCMEKDVYIEGKRVSGLDIPLDIHQIVTLGTTHFGLAPEGASWPEVKLPLISDPGGGDPGELDRDDSSKDNEQKSPAIPSAPPVSTRPAGKMRVPALCLVGVLVLAAAWGAYRSQRQDKTLAPQPDKLERAQNLLDQLQMRSLRIDTSRIDLPRIKGHLETNSEKASLVTHLKQNGLAFPLEVWTNEHLMGQAEEILTASGLDVAVASGGLGVLKLTGCVGNKENLSSLLSTMKRDIPGVVRIDSEVWTIEEVSSGMLSLLKASLLDNRVRCTVQPDYAQVDGELSEQEMERWRTVSKAFKERYERYVPLRENVAIGKHQVVATQKTIDLIAPDIKIAAVVIGNEKYIINDKGGKLFEGDKLQNGFVIQSIQEGRLYLRKGQEEVLLPYENVPIVLKYQW